MRTTLALSFALLAPLTAALVASAQTAPDAGALDELASRLLSYGGDELPELVVGQAPDKARINLEVPIFAGAKVLGTAYRSGSSFEAVMDVRGDAKAILDFYRGKFLGWEEAGPQQGVPRGGFVFSAFQGQSPYVLDTTFCKGGASLNVAVYRLRAAIKDVRVRGDSYSCSFTRRDLELPMLVPPAGADVRSQSSGFGGEITSAIVLATGSSLAEVFSGYAKQLEAARWKQTETGGLKSGALGVFEFTDAKGKAWRMLLVVTPAVGGTVRAALTAFPA